MTDASSVDSDDDTRSSLWDSLLLQQQQLSSAAAGMAEPQSLGTEQQGLLTVEQGEEPVDEQQSQVVQFADVAEGDKAVTPATTDPAEGSPEVQQLGGSLSTQPSGQQSGVAGGGVMIQISYSVADLVPAGAATATAVAAAAVVGPELSSAALSPGLMLSQTMGGLQFIRDGEMSEEK